MLEILLINIFVETFFGMVLLKNQKEICDIFIVFTVTYYQFN